MQRFRATIFARICLYVILAWSSCVATAEDTRQHVIVVIGAAGTEEFGQLFNDWATKWETAAASGDAACTVIGRDEKPDDYSKVSEIIRSAAAAESPEPLWLVMIGHGTFDGRSARFNLRGKDVAAEELAEWLSAAKRPLAIINASSSSSPFINALSAKNRVVVTATKDGGEVQFTRFGGFLAEGIGGLEADVDRDGQTSLLEAWLFAARRTQEFYESDGRLATEHSLLDDSGDEKGTRFEVFEGVRIRDDVRNRDELDGDLAHRWHLVRSEAERLLSPEQRATRDDLEQQLEALRRRRSEFAETDYLNELERILIPLAKIYENVETVGDQQAAAGNNGPDPESSATPTSKAPSE